MEPLQAPMEPLGPYGPPWAHMDPLWIPYGPPMSPLWTHYGPPMGHLWSLCVSLCVFRCPFNANEGLCGVYEDCYYYYYYYY